MAGLQICYRNVLRFKAMSSLTKYNHNAVLASNNSMKSFGFLNPVLNNDPVGVQIQFLQLDSGVFRNSIHCYHLYILVRSLLFGTRTVRTVMDMVQVLLDKHSYPNPSAC